MHIRKKKWLRKLKTTGGKKMKEEKNPMTSKLNNHVVDKERISDCH